MHNSTPMPARLPVADPYRTLLDANVNQLPPNAYCLLGLEAIEECLETIRTAATRKRSVLRARRQLADNRQWQLVSSQLEQAISTLTDEVRKDEYDRQLVEEGRAVAPGRESTATGNVSSVETRVEQVVEPSAELPAQGEVQCSNCSTLGKPNRKFCGNCGKPLWEPCPRCGTMESSNETFCGNCGFNRTEAVDELLTQCISNLDQANRLRGRGDFEAATVLLKKISCEQHPLVISYVEAARALSEDIAVERERRTEEALDALAAAQTSAADLDYDGARCALESIPPLLRNDEMNCLLGEVRTINEEVTSLIFSIRKGLDRKQYDGMQAQVIRLLELQPSRSDMRRLLGQLEKWSLKDRKKTLSGLSHQAKIMIDDRQYAEAVRLLEQISASDYTEEVQKLYERAKELSWLKDDLRRSPVTDPALLGIAKRLIKLQPEDQGAADLLKELTRRISTSPEDPREAYHDWAKPTESQKLGQRVQMLGWSQGIDSSEAPPTIRQTITQHPGRLLTACGLALQGLQQASVVTNLIPQDRGGGVFSRLTGRMRKTHSSTTWGIDLGSSALKAVRLGLGEGSQEVRILDCAIIPHEQNLQRTGINGRRAAVVQQTLKTFSEQHDLSASRLCVGFPGSKVLSRFVQLPPMPEKKLQEAIQFEARHQIPFDLDSLVWDSHVIRKRSSGSDQDLSRSVVLIAAKTGQLREYVEPFQDLGLSVDVLQSDCVALHNFLVYEFFSQPRAAQPEHEDTLPVIAVIDIGSNNINIVMSGPEMVWSRSVDQGADQLTSALVKKFKLTHDEAEQLKRNPSASRLLYQWDEALQPVMKDQLKEIRLSMGAYESDHKQKPFGHILALGGGSHLHGLLRFFNSVETASL